MAGRPGRSGGWNALSLEHHIQAGTVRPARHLKPAPPPPPALGSAGRRLALRGLGRLARRVAVGLLAQFDGWDEASLMTLRSYALSCERLEALQTDPKTPSTTLAREVRSNLALLRELGIQR